MKLWFPICEFGTRLGIPNWEFVNSSICEISKNTSINRWLVPGEDCPMNVRTGSGSERVCVLSRGCPGRLTLQIFPISSQFATENGQLGRQKTHPKRSLSKNSKRNVPQNNVFPRDAPHRILLKLITEALFWSENRVLRLGILVWPGMLPEKHDRSFPGITWANLRQFSDGTNCSRG